MNTKSASTARRLFAAMPGQSPLPHKEKEKSPHTPLKEKEISPAPDPVPAHHACACASARARNEPFGTGSDAGSVDISGKVLGSGSGTAPVGSGPAKRVKVDRDFIMYSQFDPVSIALKVLGIPKLTTAPSGKLYNNARIMRWAIRIIGEEYFRELIYRQWCENRCDGAPRNIAAAFQAKLSTAVTSANGGVA